MNTFTGVSFVWAHSNDLLCVGERMVVSLDEKQERMVKMHTVDILAFFSFVFLAFCRSLIFIVPSILAK